MIANQTRNEQRKAITGKGREAPTEASSREAESAELTTDQVNQLFTAADNAIDEPITVAFGTGDLHRYASMSMQSIGWRIAK